MAGSGSIVIRSMFRCQVATCQSRRCMHDLVSWLVKVAVRRPADGKCQGFGPTLGNKAVLRAAGFSCIDPQSSWDLSHAVHIVVARQWTDEYDNSLSAGPQRRLLSSTADLVGKHGK